MKLDKLLEIKSVHSYKSPAITELKVRSLSRKGCQCVEKDYVFADNDG